MPTAKFRVREVLPNGVYPATLVSVEERTAADGGTFWLWILGVVYAGRTVDRTATSSTNFSSKAKARQWAEALMAQKIADSGSHEFELDQLIGLRCSVVLNVVERDGETFNNVTGVLPAVSA